MFVPLAVEAHVIDHIVLRLRDCNEHTVPPLRTKLTRIIEKINIDPKRDQTADRNESEQAKPNCCPIDLNIGDGHFGHGDLRHGNFRERDGRPRLGGNRICRFLICGSFGRQI